MGKKYRESRMGFALASYWARAPQKPDRPAKHKSAKQFNWFLMRPREAGTPEPVMVQCTTSLMTN
jgi:hypothetical protein